MMDIKAYLVPLRRWWWLIVTAALIAGVASFLAVNDQPETYISRTTLMIGRTIDDPNPTGTQFTLGSQLAKTYADIANREPIRNAVRDSLGLSTLPAYNVYALPNTQLIEITVTDVDPQRAQAVAQALAEQLIQLSPSGIDPEEQERQAFINQQLDILQTQIDETHLELTAQQEELGTLFSAAQISEKQTQISALQTKLNLLQANYAALLSSAQKDAINALTLIEAASLPRAPVKPAREIIILMAVAVAVGLSATAAYGLEYLDDRVRDSEEIKEIVDLPTIGRIARIKAEDEAYKLITFDNPRSPISEAYRALRTGVQFSSIGQAAETLLITSAGPVEGKSLTAANLALVMAQANLRVLLIDADLRRPQQHKLFNLEKDSGLSNLLLLLSLKDKNHTREQIDINQFTQATDQEGLYLLTSGLTSPNPAELLGSNNMETALLMAAHCFDMVIIDSPPALTVTDAVILSARVDGVLLVVDAGKTRRGEMKRAVGLLRDVNARIIGTVLNRLTTRSEDYNYYHSYDYYEAVPERPAGIQKNSVNSNGHAKKSGFLRRSFKNMLEKRDG